MAQILASSPSLDGIRDAIAKFYGGARKRLAQVSEHSWILLRESGAQINGVRVVKKGSRFRFEAAE